MDTLVAARTTKCSENIDELNHIEDLLLQSEEADIEAAKGGVFLPEVQAQAKALSLLLAQTVREYFKDEGHRKDFEAWYMGKYGKPYQWVNISAK